MDLTGSYVGGFLLFGGGGGGGSGFFFGQTVFQVKWVISFSVNPGHEKFTLYDLAGGGTKLEAHPPLWLVWLEYTSSTPIGGGKSLNVLSQSAR